MTMVKRLSAHMAVSRKRRTNPHFMDEISWYPQPPLQAYDNTGTPTDIDKRSDDSAAMVPYWDLTDILVEGTDAIRAAGDKYLPRFADETDKQFDFRLAATKFTNVYRDIIESLSSKPFEEEISLIEAEGTEGSKIPDQITEFIEDVDGAGNNLTGFAATTFFNGLNSAIDWIFIDYPKVDRDAIRTVDQQKKAGIRPFWSHVLGRNVLEAKAQIIAGKECLVKMRILEPGKPNYIRTFDRMDGGAINWNLYREEIDTNTHQKVYKWFDGETLSIDVIPLVPFATGRRDGRSFKFFPAMRDAADLQVELYQSESGLKFVKMMTAYPMLSGNGVNPEKGTDNKPLPLAIGPAKILYGGRDANGNAGSWTFIEPSAQSLTFLAKDVEATIQQLRELGRQPLTAQSGNLTVITTAVAAGKAKSAVGAWGLLLKNSLENALVITCKWYGIKDADYSPEVSVYDDYDNFTEGSGDLEHLRAMREKGDLSQRTMWRETKRRRILSAEFDDEDEIRQLLEEVPGDGEDDPEIGSISGTPIVPAAPVVKPPTPQPKPAPIEE